MTTNDVSDTRISTEILQQIIDGCEGVTPGPWDEAAGLVRAIDGDVAIPIFESRDPWKKHRHATTVVRQGWHNRHHIARLDPATVKAMAELALSALASHHPQPKNILTLLDELEAKDRCIAELDKALEPFAAEADQWEDFYDTEALVEGWSDGPASSVTVGDLRFARATLQGSSK